MTEPEFLTRTFETVDVTSDGRNLEILCVPFNTPARVADPPDFTPYMEEFLPGCAPGAVKAPNRVLLDFEHQSGIRDVLGFGRHFEHDGDALLGHFRMDDGSDGDKALRLIDEGVLRGASVTFKSLTKAVKSAAGVIQRTKIHLDRVALCRVGAYETAQVLAVRTAPIIPESAAPIPFNPELAANLAKYATVPDRLTHLEAST